MSADRGGEPGLKRFREGPEGGIPALPAAPIRENREENGEKTADFGAGAARGGCWERYANEAALRPMEGVRRRQYVNEESRGLPGAICK